MDHANGKAKEKNMTHSLWSHHEVYRGEEILDGWKVVVGLDKGLPQAALVGEEALVYQVEPAIEACDALVVAHSKTFLDGIPE
jgi:hypothetical protein